MEWGGDAGDRILKNKSSNKLEGGDEPTIHVEW